AAALVAVGCAVLRWRPFGVVVAGSSMAPALEPGDWALAVVARRDPRRGSVVVVEHPERPGFEIVKRVVAVAGDVAPGGRALADGELWVQGDAPDGSTDSRHFGVVRRDQVRGSIVLVYWPAARRRLM
ncbi:MAG TPA: S26 family signal peptidase, partial [Actinomycetota bacterium]